MIRFYSKGREIYLKEIRDTLLPESTYHSFYTELLNKIEKGEIYYKDDSVKTIQDFCNQRIHQREDKIREQIMEQYLHSFNKLSRKLKKKQSQEYRKTKAYKITCQEAFDKDDNLQKWQQEEFRQEKYAEYLDYCKEKSMKQIRKQIDELFLLLKEDAFLQLDISSIFQNNCLKIVDDFQEELNQALENKKIHIPVLVEDIWARNSMIYETEELNVDNLAEFIENFQEDPEETIADLLYEDEFLDYYVVKKLFEKADELKALYEREEDINIFMELFSEAFDVKYDVLDSMDYTGYHILRCLMKNPNYKEMATHYYQEARNKLDAAYFSEQEIKEMKRRQQEREMFLKNSILSSIPRMYKDLYPMARKIQRKFILHIGPTNSGKTYHAMKALRENGSGIYLAPLRLLAYEQFENLNMDGYACDLVTGEETTRIPFATYQSSTIEVADYSYHYSMAVIDEAQMIEDSDRGGAWTMAILGLWCDEIHVCAAPYALDRIIALIDECGDCYEVITHKRDTRLVMEKAYFHFPEDVRQKDALIVFSKKNVHAVASELQRMGRKCSIIYGNLPYDVRQEEARKFMSGETDILVSTDAIGMGMNLPIRRIVFLETKKFDGKKIRPLKVEEIQQIAGRAGRKGMYDVGLVNAEVDKKLIQKALDTEVPPIINAVINFPESLLGIDAPLSETLERWNNIKTNAGYDKANIEEQIRLCRELEAECEDKKLIYNFITIPFESGNVKLKYMWSALFQDELQGNEYNYKRFLPDLETSVEANHINGLEESYRICDLLYFYMVRFHGKENFEDIVDLKKAISAQIIKILNKQKFVSRKCKKCRKPLPWNHNYNTCESCHRKEKEDYAWRHSYHIN